MFLFDENRAARTRRRLETDRKNRTMRTGREEKASPVIIVLYTRERIGNISEKFNASRSNHKNRSLPACRRSATRQC